MFCKNKNSRFETEFVNFTLPLNFKSAEAKYSRLISNSLINKNNVDLNNKNSNFGISSNIFMKRFTQMCRFGNFSHKDLNILNNSKSEKIIIENKNDYITEWVSFTKVEIEKYNDYMNLIQSAIFIIIVLIIFILIGIIVLVFWKRRNIIKYQPVVFEL